jgi:hypothetical protein
MVAAVLGGCGSGSGSDTRARALKTISQRDAAALQLGYPEAALLKRFGDPEKRLEQAPFECLVYATDAGPDTWLRMCFKGGRMTGIATIPGRQTAMTLNPPGPRGPGHLKGAKRVGPLKR